VWHVPNIPPNTCSRLFVFIVPLFSSSAELPACASEPVYNFVVELTQPAYITLDCLKVLLELLNSIL
jgi:hypothetical protein